MKPWRPLGILAASWAMVLAWAAPLSARDWLDLRRAGPPAILAEARRASAPQPWQAVYAATIPKEHPLLRGLDPSTGPSELRLTVLRLPPAEAKASSPRATAAQLDLGRWMVRFDAPAPLAGAGLVADGRKLWLKTPGKKAQLATPSALAQAIPALGLPWLVFALSELPGTYDYALEGEFGDAAVLRCRPAYTAPPGLPQAKLGVHKRWTSWTLQELIDRDGKRQSLAEWQRYEDHRGVPVPAGLFLHPPAGAGPPLTLTRRSLAIGDGVPKAVSAQLLR